MKKRRVWEHHLVGYQHFCLLASYPNKHFTTCSNTKMINYIHKQASVNLDYIRRVEWKLVDSLIGFVIYSDNSWQITAVLTKPKIRTYQLINQVIMIYMQDNQSSGSGCKSFSHTHFPNQNHGTVFKAYRTLSRFPVKTVSLKPTYFSYEVKHAFPKINSPRMYRLTCVRSWKHVFLSKVKVCYSFNEVLNV